MLKIFLLTKNETDFIADWLKYHGYLFGLENIHVLDGSDDRSVLEVYAKFGPLGLNVHFSSSGLNSLGEELTRLMHAHKGTDHFLIKLDTDEFLAYTRPFLLNPQNVLERAIRMRYLKSQRKSHGLRKRLFEDWMDRRHAYKSVYAADISRMFRELPVTGQRYKASLTAWSIPTVAARPGPVRRITQFTPLQFTHMKSFFHSSSFVSVDLGCHSGVSTRNKGVIDTGLTVIHFHSTSVEDSARRARQVLVSHGYITGSDDRAEQRRKLTELKARRRVDSIHKIDLYLEYLDYLDHGREIDPARLNMQHPYFRQPGPPVELTLIRDTLAEIDARGIY